MERETLLLRGLFGVCVLVCVLALGAMLTATALRQPAATGTRVLAKSPTPCAMADPNATCPAPQPPQRLAG